VLEEGEDQVSVEVGDKFREEIVLSSDLFGGSRRLGGVCHDCGFLRLAMTSDSEDVGRSCGAFDNS